MTVTASGTSSPATTDGVTLSVDGVDITAPSVNSNDVRKRIGIVFQSFNLISFKNAMENVALPLYYQGVSRKKRNKIARNGKASEGFDSQKKCDSLRILIAII